jgi:2,3-bisphosphoglycerate-dependent phosphoglycerate mutase
LVLVRHGESQGNQRNVFTGWLDLPLTAKGLGEARAAGVRLREQGFNFGTAFTSALSRAVASCDALLAQLDLGPVDRLATAALNERDYGELAGLDKDQARARFGADQVRLWRRSYAFAPPGGESLRDTAARVLPFYIHRILPAVMRDEGVLVVAHGNSLRALVMALDHLTPEGIEDAEIATGEMRIYSLNPDTTVATREIIHVAQ